MKHTISKIFAGALLLGTVSCTANYLDINSNPYQPGDLTGAAVSFRAQRGPKADFVPFTVRLSLTGEVW